MLARAKQSKAELSDDAFNIKETGRFCTERMRDATDDLVTGYLTVGKALADLRRRLKKTTPRGDNEHVGWKQAFKQTREDGRQVFPFGRMTAEKYIIITEFFEAIAIAPKIHKQLPSALNALVAIVNLKLSRAQIEKAIEDKTITTFTQANDVRRLAKQLGLVHPKNKAAINKATIKATPKRERIARAFELLAKLGVTVDDLIEETGGRK